MQRMMKASCVIAVAAAVMLMGGVAHANLILDPSFELDNGSWTISGAADILVNHPVAAGGSDGTKAGAYVAGGGNPGSGIFSQSFATTAGLTYTLDLDTGKVGSDNTDIQVTVDGIGNLLTDTINTPGAQVGWLHHSYSFVADTTSATLAFEDVTANATPSCDHGIDMVIVEEVLPPVAEPTSAGLLLVGVAGLIRRRRG